MTIILHHNGPSTCSQKVRLVLAEKGLDYESREINIQAGEQHDPDYVKLNPNHVVPTLEHAGGVFIESALISEYLDDAFHLQARPSYEAAVTSQVPEMVIALLRKNGAAVWSDVEALT